MKKEEYKSGRVRMNKEDYYKMIKDYCETCVKKEKKKVRNNYFKKCSII